MYKQSFDTLLFTLPIIMYVSCDLLAVGYLNCVFLMQASEDEDGFPAGVGVTAASSKPAIRVSRTIKAYS